MQVDAATIDRLGDEIAELAAHIGAAEQRLLTQIRQFDDIGGWGVQGATSCAHWLSWRIGLGIGTAREHVRVARALASLPLIDEAFSRGVLSYSKVRAMTRIATPEMERALLAGAKGTTGAQLERICRAYRSVDPQRDRSEPEGRSVRKVWREDGRVELRIVLEADEAEVVLKAVDSAVEALRGAKAEGDVPAGTRPTRADGVRLVAESYLEKGPAAGTGGDRYQVLVHLEADMLAKGGLVTKLEDGTRVPAGTFRRIACDASLVPALLGERGNPLDVGRKTRTIPASIRRALGLRDVWCRFPGCTNRAWLHGHHVQSWLHGGETKLSNLILLCLFHHQLVHEGGFKVEALPSGDFRFARPDGRAIPRVAPPTEAPDGLDAIRAAHRAAGLSIDHATTYPEGDCHGTIADAVSALFDVCLRRVPAGTSGAIGEGNAYDEESESRGAVATDDRAAGS